MATNGTKKRNAQRFARISDITKEPHEMLMPISGYENEPLVSLETAVQPLIPLLPTIQRYVDTSKERCKNPADNLTQDESASLMLYSMELKPASKSLYVVLNETLRSKDRQNLKPWFSYLKLFLTALSRLPSERQFVYRGVKLDLSEKYPIGENVVWWGFSSCTVSINVLQSENFLGNKGERTIFNIDCYSGKNIQKHSYYPTEDEVLLLAATQFKIVGCLDNGGGYHTIHLKEIEPPFPLLQPVMPVINEASSSETQSSSPLLEPVMFNSNPEPPSPGKSDEIFSH
ncbi:unnamed protein product [Rotaria sp. Silwood1]|nr:unnamed protein product [Rotaria sp. Silwood1]CAF5010934.1 unnamed protein product [Rotaria sp. Silwood1]